MESGPARIGKTWSEWLRRYYRGGDHPFKVRLWGMMRRLQQHRRFTVRYGAGWLTVDERCFMQRAIFTSDTYEPEVADALLGQGASREVVWDVGANIGSFSVTARMDPRVAEVLSFEPDPDNRAVLEQNLALNGGAPFRIESCALSDRVGTSVLAQGPVVNRGLSRLVDGSGTESSCIVETQTMDRLVFEQGLPAPTLMKVDVEGWEYPVFLGARRILSECPPKAIVFEGRCRADGSIENLALLDLLRDHGYEVHKVVRGEPSVDAQENFLAVRRETLERP